MALLVPDVPDDNGKSVRIHQWRLKYKETELKEARDQVVKDFLGCNGMEFENFEEFYEKVRQSILKIDFIGPLTVYDVAKRHWYALGHNVQGTEQAWVVAGARDGLVGLVGKEKAKSLLRGKALQQYGSYRRPSRRIEMYGRIVHRGFPMRDASYSYKL